MDLTDLIVPEAIIPALKAGSKKQLLQIMAEKAATLSGLPERDIFDTIFQREKLGSTGLAMVLLFRMANWPSLITSSAFLPVCKCQSILRRSMTSRLIWSLCCWRRKMLVPIT